MTGSEPPVARLAGVVLAAGASTRFGSPKQLARVGEGTMLEAVLQVARDAGLDPILAVVPPGLAVPTDVVPIVNDDPGAGLSRSVQLGIHAIPEDVAAAVLLLGDQPTLDPATVRAVVHARGAGPLVATEADGLRAPPVLIERPAFELVDRLSGDAGFRDLLQDPGSTVATVGIASHAPDVDVVADLEALSDG